MNNARRKELSGIADRVRAIADLVSDIVGDLEALRDEEQDYFDNMPESLQGSEKGEIAEAAITAMEDALSTLEDFDVESIGDSIDEAAS